MKPLASRSALVLFACAVLVAAGCARRTEPPVPPPAPPQAQPPAPPPETPPAPPEPPAPPQERAPEFEPVYFDFDSYALRDDARRALDANAKLLRGNAGTQVTIEGHCDERGTVEYNQALGERRAQAARDYLVGAGIDGSRVRVISYGKERPFANGHDEDSWQQNRRAHFSPR